MEENCFEIKEIGKIWRSRRLYYVIGNRIYTYIGFGVIDRGTNVLQVRPTTLCPLNCIFCSVDAGPYSRNRIAEFFVDLDTIVDTVEDIAGFKGGGVEALIDTIGEGLTYPHIYELVKTLKKNPLITSVALETHGVMLTYEVVEKLEEAGLDRINLSIDTLNPEKARMLQGVKWYDVERIMRIAEYITRETSIDLHVTPIWIPGINDEDVIEVIEWAYRIGAGKKWPPATIQKYVVHKYGRRVPGIKEMSWREFWKKLEEIEMRYGIRVKWPMEEWGMYRVKRYPCPRRHGELVMARIVSYGVFRGEYLGLDLEKNVLLTIVGRNVHIGGEYLVEIVESKDCLLIGKAVKEIHI